MCTVGGFFSDLAPPLLWLAVIYLIFITMVLQRVTRKMRAPLNIALRLSLRAEATDASAVIEPERTLQ